MPAACRELWKGGWSCLVAGLVIGALYAGNTWDFPTYLLIMLAALALPYLAVTHAQGVGWPAAVRALGHAVGDHHRAQLCPFLPFHLSFTSLVGGRTVQVPENLVAYRC